MQYPGSQPQLVSGSPNVTFFVATRKSQHKASSKPPPKA